MDLNQFSTVDIVLDKANDNIIQKQTISAGDRDGRSLTLQVTDAGSIGEVPGLTANLLWTNHSSGVSDLSAFSVVDRTTSVFRFIYPQNMLTAGKVTAQIQLLHNGKVTLSKKFEIIVLDIAGKLKGVLQTAEYTALVEALAKTNEFETDIAEVSAQLANTTQRAKNAQVDLCVDFGASIENPDNHTNIISALDYLDSKGGGVLLVPNGEFKTAPLDLIKYRNIIIRGTSPSQPWKNPSCFKIISSGDVGVKLTEISGLGYHNEVPVKRAINITIEHFRIDANKKVTFGLNGNYGITLNDVTVDNALLDGIVFEPQTYPFTMNKVWSRYNGRHGLWIKAPYTTVYNFNQVELAYNDGYGMLIEDGNTSLFNNVLCQGNKQGGVKINKLNPGLFTHDIFLGNLMFTGLYTEANGTLSIDHPNYDGNVAVKIRNYNTTQGLNVGKITGLTFIGCSINKSENGRSWDIEGVDNITTINTLPTPTESDINYQKSGTMGMGTDINAIRDGLESGAPIVKSFPYYNSVGNIKSFVGNGYVGKRGRMRELHFNLPGSSISAGQKVIMDTINPVKFYPVLQTGTLYGINVLQGIKPTSGKLTFKIRRGFKIYAPGGFDGFIDTAEVIEIDSTKNQMSVSFPLLKYTVNKEHILGIEVSASEDYVPSTNTANTYLICELFLES